MRKYVRIHVRNLPATTDRNMSLSKIKKQEQRYFAHDGRLFRLFAFAVRDHSDGGRLSPSPRQRAVVMY